MIQYILEAITFQLVFLIIYDFWLKRETFFQWNRAYLLSTYALSIVLPWVKIEAFKTKVPEAYYVYPEFLWNTNDMAAVTVSESKGVPISWEYVLLFGGMVLATLFFVNKLRQLYGLKKKGRIRRFPDFTQIIISNSQIAFSFFKSIFLGDRVLQGDYKSVIAHELVHIKQRHTYDLLFFELMRIVCWFNPLVYVYQSRVAELHEFIADAQVAKDHKKEHYQLLLSQLFETQHISFINQFFKSSLIKKRIVMLQKKQSKKIWQLKYLLMVPLISGILLYTSCEKDTGDSDTLIESIAVADIEHLTAEEEVRAFDRLTELSAQQSAWSYTIKDENSSVRFSNPKNEDSYISGPDGVPLKANMHIESKVLKEDFDLFHFSPSKPSQTLIGTDIDVPFAVIDEVPIFPGCEDAENKRTCFQKSIQKHISKNFKYPLAAQEKGIQGRVSMMFTIAKDGSIENIRYRGPDPLLEQEAKRIISKLPKMVPGKLNGEVVNVPFSIPITFKLQDDTKSAVNGQLDYMQIKDAHLAAMPEESRSAFENTISVAEVDEVPVFPGCEDAVEKRACFQKSMQKHISKNFNYPKVAQEKGIQGRVSVMFIIGKDGAISNAKFRGPDPLLEEEARRIIGRLPQMKPGKKNGETVSVPYSIPITFKLQ